MVLLERDALLQDLASQAAKPRRESGCLVLVGGEAGVGKTSLLRAFEQRLRGVRVLWGACDAVSPARPFAPVVDIGAVVDGRLARALEARDRDEIFDAFLELLRATDGPAPVVVFDDLHWADDATLDLLRVVGRRMGTVAAPIIGSYRTDEVSEGHPLRLALGDIPAQAVVELTVPPLSLDAVRALARGAGMDPRRLHVATGGNAFFVTEVIAAGDETLPQTVRDAVLARVAHLPPPARDMVLAASVLVPWCEPELLLEVSGRGTRVLDELLTRGILVEAPGGLAFRHEIAARAVLESLAPTRRSAIHRGALRALRRRDDHPGFTRLSRHAVGAGDGAAIVELAPLAGREAAELGAHREAVIHLRAAVEHRTRLDIRARAELLELLAAESRLTDEIADAHGAIDEAIACWQAIGDAARGAECLRQKSLILYLEGSGDRAIEAASQAVETLERAGTETSELAASLATLANRIFVAGRDDPAALATAARARRLGERWRDERVVVDALITIGSTQIFMANDAGWSKLEEALGRALRAGLVEEAARAFINIIETATVAKRFVVAERHLDPALAFLDAHDLIMYHRLLLGRRAELALEQGRWDFAVAEAQSLVDLPRTTALTRIRSLTLIGRVRARRGESGAWNVLDEALERVHPAEIQEVCPLRAARAEAAWLSGDLATARSELRAGLPLALAASSSPMPWWWAELSYWSWRLGLAPAVPDSIPEPYRLLSMGLFREAGAAWRALGSPYQEALALAESEDEADLRAALVILQRLGARPLAASVTQRLRESGARSIPRGPHRATRRNRAGLTPRQAEVLELVVQGLRNRQIAERLVVSEKTVDHHLAAIFRKLGVHDRRAAAREATRAARNMG